MIPKIMSTHERPIREELEKIAQYMKLRVQMASSTQSLQEEVPEESSAWPLSGTIQEGGCESPFITALADTLLRLTMEGYNTGDTGEVDYDDKSPIYAGLIKVIRDAIHEVDLQKTNVSAENAGLIHQPMFSSDHDEWEMAYSTRTGLPLNEFHERWSLLKKAAPRQEPPGGEHRFGPGSRAFSRDQLITIVKSEREDYFNSYPGNDTKAKNVVLHNDLRRLINGTEIPSASYLGYLRDQIDYRVNHVMRTATGYKEVWGLNIPKCEVVGVKKAPGIGSSRWREMLELVASYPLFDGPHGQGAEYEKGEWYLASCIYHEKWTRAQAEEKLNSLVRFRGKSIF
jgi:hypothetical protein